MFHQNIQKKIIHVKQTLNSATSNLFGFKRKKTQKGINTSEDICSVGVVDVLFNDRMTQAIESCIKAIDDDPGEIKLPDYKNMLDKIPKDSSYVLYKPNKKVDDSWLMDTEPELPFIKLKGQKGSNKYEFGLKTVEKPKNNKSSNNHSEVNNLSNENNEAKKTELENQDANPKKGQLENQNNGSKKGQLVNQNNGSKKGQLVNQNNEANKSQLENHYNIANKNHLENQNNGTNKDQLENQNNGTKKGQLENQNNGPKKGQLENQNNGSNKSQLKNHNNGSKKGQVDKHDNRRLVHSKNNTVKQARTGKKHNTVKQSSKSKNHNTVKQTRKNKTRNIEKKPSNTKKHNTIKQPYKKLDRKSQKYKKVNHRNANTKRHTTNQINKALHTKQPILNVLAPAATGMFNFGAESVGIAKPHKIKNTGLDALLQVSGVPPSENVNHTLKEISNSMPIKNAPVEALGLTSHSLAPNVFGTLLSSETSGLNSAMRETGISGAIKNVDLSDRIPKLSQNKKHKTLNRAIGLVNSNSLGLNYLSRAIDGPLPSISVDKVLQSISTKK